MTVNGRALTALSTGILFVWSGIRGWSVLSTIGDVVTGVKPNESVSYPLSVGPPQTAGAAVGTGNATGLAAIALAYQGHAYHFGGAPGRDGSRPWDCSSFVNFVVAVKAGMAIPGNSAGTYNGTTHGPTTGVWAIWTGMSTVKRADVQSGDILVWGSHMGIATDNSHYISAHSPAKGTTVTGIPTTGLGPLVRIGRL
jgi:cell wall-associated NlpC family hydrolase